MNITFESQYKTFWYFFLLEKPKKPNKTRVLLKKPSGLVFFYKKNQVFSNPGVEGTITPQKNVGGHVPSVPLASARYAYDTFDIY